MRDGLCNQIAKRGLRLSLSAAFLSAVADRFGLWGGPGAPNVAWGAWKPFVVYTGKLLPFLPPALVQIAALVATAAETGLALLLLVGWRGKVVALASAALLLVFALSMTFSLGIKPPLNYSVFTAAAAGLGLAALETQSNQE
jgi:hypothetical protein